MSSFKSIKLSAPGKIILCGEHAVVYGKKAIACAINKRTYLSAAYSTGHDYFKVNFNDLNIHLLVDESTFRSTMKLFNEKELDILIEQESIDQITHTLNESSPNDSKELLTLKVLFLISSKSLRWDHLRSFEIDIKSDLPVSGGLGSSASLSTCLSALFLMLTSRVQVKKEEFTQTELPLINKTAYLLEKIFHGKPSGVDNMCSTYGRYVLYQRDKLEEKFDSPMKLTAFIVNTRLPKQTKEQVAKVRALYDKHTTLVGLLMEAIDSLVDRFLVYLKSDNSIATFDDKNLRLTSSSSSSSLSTTLNELVSINQGILCSLQVSNAKINEIVNLASHHGNYSCKITGAGGGGCCFILLLNEEPDSNLIKLNEKLTGELNYETFLTSLGCKGVTIEQLN